ncbi:MAG: hypothetical protein CO090_05700 [Acidobacteria bacterium CG_4_9_14_3_um_filter_49_7]|nr:MAG: hypothetical protein CO090_05700 [Acidobacteria bacterium CG_4_9_14_3_um_filter_49_7]
MDGEWRIVDGDKRMQETGKRGLATSQVPVPAFPKVMGRLGMTKIEERPFTFSVRTQNTCAAGAQNTSRPTRNTPLEMHHDT